MRSTSDKIALGGIYVLLGIVGVLGIFSAATEGFRPFLIIGGIIGGYVLILLFVAYLPPILQQFTMFIILSSVAYIFFESWLIVLYFIGIFIVNSIVARFIQTEKARKVVNVFFWISIGIGFLLAEILKTH